MPLTVGSYRFGPSSGSVLLDQGKPHDPKFGLTVDPQGGVVLYPPRDGVLLDGEKILEPRPMNVGQVIRIGQNRFGLRTQAWLTTNRTSVRAEDSVPMPTPKKGRGVDSEIIDWVVDHRRRTLRAMWAGLASPAEIHHRISENQLFGVLADHPVFGHALLGAADVRYTPPQELTNANKATIEAAAAYDSLPGAPISVDLNNSSLALVGPPDMCRAVGTWIVISMAAVYAPTSLGCAVRDSKNIGSWGWVDRLPHVDPYLGRSLTLTIVEEKRPVVNAGPGKVVLYPNMAAVPDEIGAVLELGPTSATYTDRTGDAAVAYDIAPIGLANVVAVERSLTISQHLTSIEEQHHGTQ